MPTPGISTSRRIEIGILLLVICSVIGFSLWWRNRELARYWAEMATPSGGSSQGGGSASVDDLIEQLGSSNSLARIEAVESLSSRKIDAVQPLMQALRSENAHTRKHAAMALGRIGPPAAVALPELCQALDDRDTNVVGESLFSIAKIGVNSPEIVAATENQLNSESAEIRKLAIDALVAAKDLGVPALSAALSHTGPDTRTRAAMELATYEPDSEQVLTVLLDAFKARRNQNTVGLTLKSLGARIVPHFIEMLHDQDAVVRKSAIEFLGSLEPPPHAALPELIQCLNDTDMWFMAMSALERFGADAIDAVPLLLHLMDDKDWDVRFKAARTMSAIDPRNPTLVDRLIVQLRSDVNSNVRREAAKTLGQLGDIAERAIPDLRQAMQADEGHVQLAASRALWRLTGDAETAFVGIRSVLNTRWSNDALELVRELGIAAKPLVPDLVNRCKKSFNPERQRLAEIIKSLDAEGAKRAGIE